VIEALEAVPNAKIIWCQEEPKNMGSWTFVRDFIEDAMEKAGSKQSRPIYAGRAAAASPATGSLSRHKLEQQALVEDALGFDKESGKAAAE
jgi:2-oxoglutarate dehydrogenase E1 component